MVGLFFSQPEALSRSHVYADQLIKDGEKRMIAGILSLIGARQGHLL